MTLATSRSLPTAGAAPAEVERLCVVRGVAVGGAVLVGLYGLLSGGVLPAGVAGVSPLVLLVLVPTSRLLTRRLAVNGLLLLALVPCLWWFRWPIPVDHGAIVVSATVAGVSGWVLSAGTSSRVRSLVPVGTRSDLLLAFAAVAAGVTTHRWWSVGSPRSALSVLLRGYDNNAHFDIFSKVLAHGATLDSLGRAPDGSAWSLADYPQGFHTVAATYAELISPGTLTGPSALATYSHCVAAIVVLGTVVLVATVCSLPGLRARSLVAAPTVVVVLAAFLWGPGQKSLLDGFVNFWLAALAGACALALAVDTPRRLSPVHWAALGAALVVVAHSWAPLLLLAGPAALVALPVRGHAEPSSRVRVALTGLVAASTVICLVRAAWLLLHAADVRDVVTADGGITSPSPLPTLLLVPLSLLTFVECGLWLRRSSHLAIHGPLATVVRRLSSATLLGLASLVVLLFLQLRSGGLGYYFFKYLVGFELVMGAVTAAAAGVCLSLCLPRGRSRSGVAVLASLGTCLIATQAFGRVGWQSLLPAPSPPTTEAVGEPLPSSDVADGILAASSRVSMATAPYRYYLAPVRSHTKADSLPAAWVQALEGGMTDRQQARMRFLVPAPVTQPELVRCTRALLESDVRVKVLVRPSDLAPVRSALGDVLGARVTTWSRAASVEAQRER